MQEKCSQSIGVAAAALPVNAGKVFTVYRSGCSRFAVNVGKVFTVYQSGCSRFACESRKSVHSLSEWLQPLCLWMQEKCSQSIRVMQEKCWQSIRVVTAALPVNEGKVFTVYQSNAGKVFTVYQSGYSCFAFECRKSVYSLSEWLQLLCLRMQEKCSESTIVATAALHLIAGNVFTVYFTNCLSPRTYAVRQTHCMSKWQENVSPLPVCFVM